MSAIYRCLFTHHACVKCILEMLHQRTHHTLAIGYGVPVRDMDTWTHGNICMLVIPWNFQPQMHTIKWCWIHVSPNMNAACISRSVDGAEMGSGKRLIHVRPYQYPNMPFLSNRMKPNDTNSIIVLLYVFYNLSIVTPPKHFNHAVLWVVLFQHSLPTIFN